MINLYRVFDVKAHLKQKNAILKDIENSLGWQKYITTDFKGDYTSFISKTNWYSDLRSSRSKFEWPNFLTEEDYCSFVDFLKKECGDRGPQWMASEWWYNQYDSNSGSDHPWHNHAHPNCIACIYYVELDESSELVTIIRDPITGEEVIPEVKEGQILTLDANIFHKSPRNFTNTRKTIISFNIKFR